MCDWLWVKALTQQWFLGVALGFFLARTGSILDIREQIKRERRKLFNSYLDEINAHDIQTELLVRTPDELRPLGADVWQRVKTSGELWAMNQETLNHILTYGELVERYNYHHQRIEWLKREILDHPTKQLNDHITNVQKQLTDRLKMMQKIKRETASEVKWWMQGQGLLSGWKWKQWLKRTEGLKKTVSELVPSTEGTG